MSYNKMFMERAIELAKRGIGAVNPNPLVGAVIVKDGTILGEGYHTKYGELHAEREALADAEKRGNDVKGSEIYVTLEPCAHTGKQPPCTEAIIEAGIKRVYVGSDDPNPLVDGGGIWQLRMNGIEVVTHCMKAECDALNDVFFHYITQKTPYVIYKYAMTADGKTCTYSGKSRWISGEESRELVQSFRNEYMAIMVGINTVLKDNPSLTCHKQGGRNPIRIICDSDLQIPMDSEIVRTAENIKTYVASVAENEKKNRQKIRELREKKVGCLLIPADKDGHVDLQKLLIQLGKMKIDSVLLEGGGNLAWSMISQNLVNEFRCFIAPKLFGGVSAGTPVSGIGYSEVEDAPLLKLEKIDRIEDDVYLIYKPLNNVASEDETEES